MNNTPIKQNRKLEGIVVSDKMDKTIVVSVVSYQKHPKYLKYMKSTKRYKAHDEENKCVKGETVEIVETRPISKDKKFIVKG